MAAIVPRKEATRLCRVHGYHGRRDDAVAFYRAGWISFKQYSEAYLSGANDKKVGHKCNCLECEKECLQLSFL